MSVSLSVWNLSIDMCLYLYLYGTWPSSIAENYVDWNENYKTFCKMYYHVNQGYNKLERGILDFNCVLWYLLHFPQKILQNFYEFNGWIAQA